jgi:hypothetical protein
MLQGVHEGRWRGEGENNPMDKLPAVGTHPWFEMTSREDNLNFADQSGSVQFINRKLPNERLIKLKDRDT